MERAYQELTDFELIRQMQARDRRAYFYLKDRYEARLRGMAQDLLDKPHQANELVRRVFEQSWKQSAHWDPGHQRSGALWLYGLVREQALVQQQRWPWIPSAKVTGDPVAGMRRLTGILVVLVAGLGISTGWALWQWWQVSQVLGRVAVADPGMSRDVQEAYQQWQGIPETRRLTLRDPQRQTGTLAQLLWSPQEKRGILLGTQIPAVHPGLTYQLWVSGTDPNRADSAGTFVSAADETVQWLSEPVEMEDPRHFWVTLEPLGGSELPTGFALLETRAF